MADDLTLRTGIVHAPKTTGRLYIVLHADGRKAYPKIVQYRVTRFNGTEFTSSIADLPPVDSGIIYHAIVHDLTAYDWLRQHGWLEYGHRMLSEPVTTGS